MFRPNRWTKLAAAALAATTAAAALADHDYGIRPNAKISRLKAEMRLSGHDWRVDVDYRVRIRDAWAAPLVLVLYVTDDQGVLTDPQGEPIEIGIPLERPSDTGRRGDRFEAGVVMMLPDGAFARPDRLRIQGMVIDERDGAVLDRDDSRIRFRESVVYEPVPVYGGYVGAPAVYGPVYGPAVRRSSIHVGVNIGRRPAYSRVIRSAPAPVLHRRTVIHQQRRVAPAPRVRPAPRVAPAPRVRQPVRTPRIRTGSSRLNPSAAPRLTSPSRRAPQRSTISAPRQNRAAAIAPRRSSSARPSAATTSRVQRISRDRPR